MMVCNAAIVQKQIDLRDREFRKPAIFNRLNFVESLEAGYEQQFGELEKIILDGKTPNKIFNGMKELTDTGALA